VGERPPQQLLAVAHRPRPAGLGQGEATPCCARTIGGPPLPGFLAARSNGHPKRLFSYDQTWFKILLQILIFHIFIQNIFGFQKLYKNKIWKRENLYYQKIIFIRFSEKFYF